MTSADAWLAEVKARVAELEARDVRRVLPGAALHLYRWGPTLSEEELATVEHWLGGRLPEEVRRFLRELGNGGAGPGEGLERIGWIDDTGLVIPHVSGLSRGYYTGIVVAAASKNRLWQDFGLEGPVLPVDVFGDEGNVRVEAAGALGDRIEDGTFVVADYGAGIVARLVLAGARAGEIWIDDRPNTGGVADYATWVRLTGESAIAPRGSSFRDWYSHWVDVCFDDLESGRFEGHSYAPAEVALPHPLDSLRELRESRARVERERVAIRRKHAAREARRAAELPGIEARSAAILTSIHAPKDGMSVPGACARCGTETELRVCGTTMVLCRPCWMAW